MIKAAGPIALLLETAVADFAQAVEEHGAGQRVAGLAFVQLGMHAAAQLDALQPVQDEQRALDAAQLAQSKVDPEKWTKGLDRMPRSERGDRRGKKAV
jgi:hypothetical protein